MCDNSWVNATNNNNVILRCDATRNYRKHQTTTVNCCGGCWCCPNENVSREQTKPDGSGVELSKWRAKCEENQKFFKIYKNQKENEILLRIRMHSLLSIRICKRSTDQCFFEKILSKQTLDQFN